jgi:hypothetical protein
MNYPIILQSPSKNGFQFFRRVNADLTVEAKQLGGEWAPHEPAKLTMLPDKYVYQMTRRLNWTVVNP